MVAFRLPEALRLAGREAWLREQGAEALDWWRQAVDCCQRLDTRPELGRTLSEAAQAFGAGLAGGLGGRDAAACRGEAIALFEALGLRFDRAQIADAV
jgi:hypothetical protein